MGLAEPTVERRALDALLERYPAFDVLSIDWQLPGYLETAYGNDRIPGSWLIVELGQRSSDGSEVWARHRFAIFKRTGAIHGLQADGSVTDDPLLPLG